MLNNIFKYHIKKNKKYSNGNKIDLFKTLISIPIISISLFFIDIPNMVWLLIPISITLGVYYNNISSKDMRFQAFFGKNAVYKDKEIVNYKQVNKLYGFSEGMHLQNSCRIGWRSNGKKIEFFLYCHVDGKIEFKKLGESNSGKWVSFILKTKDKNYLGTIINDKGNSSTRKIERSKNIKKLSRILLVYKLFPYFGGKYSSPNDLLIKLKTKIFI